MVLKDILAISGSNGLFRLISKARNGIIVEGLIDKKRIHSPASAKMSALDDISVYTSDKDVPLKEILQNIYRKENGGQTIDPKSETNQLKKYFLEVLPDYDQDRVYASDIKKIYTWYNILQSLQMIDLINEDVPSDIEKEPSDIEKEPSDIEKEPSDIEKEPSDNTQEPEEQSKNPDQNRID